MRSMLTTLVELVGLAAISAGCGLIWEPIGVIVAGLALVLVGWRLG